MNLTKNGYNYISYFILFNLIFFHIFNLKINLPPYNLILINTIFAFFLILFKKFKVNFEFYNILILIYIQFFVLMVSFLLNQNIDYYFLKEIIFFEVVSLLSAYFVSSNFFVNDESKFEKISYFVFFVVVFQLILSFLGYLNQEFFNILFGIFNLGNEDIITDLSQERMVGVGASFFGSGVIVCLVLLLIASFIVTEDNSKNKLTLIILYFIIAMLGMLSARTTSIGIILSLILIFMNFKDFKLKLFLLVLLVLFVSLITSVDSFSDTKLGILLNFSIGFLVNFNGSNASNSTSELLEMYLKLPNNFKTWIIGDTFYRDGYGYYMGTDVGYFRFIFATGILGLFSYCLFIIYMVVKINSYRITALCKILIILLFFILMGKGVSIFFPILLLLYFSSNGSICGIRKGGFN